MIHCKNAELYGYPVSLLTRWNCGRFEKENTVFKTTNKQTNIISKILNIRESKVDLN